MRIFQNHFSKAHGYIFVGLLLGFMALTCLMAGSGSESDLRERSILVTTFGSILGPFTGGLARHWQTCCLHFSLNLFPFCGAAVGIGTLFQLIPLPRAQFARAVRLGMWTLGLLGWFLGIPISFLHAFS